MKKIMPMKGMIGILSLVDNIVTLDFETTGFSAERDEIIQVGAIKYRNGFEIARFDRYIQPRQVIPYRITQLTGITEQMVQDAPPLAHTLIELYNFLKDEGFEPVKFKNITGLYCDVGNWSGDYPLIGIRADIDALYQEVNGKLQANHSCGHDSHIAMVIGTMLKIKDHESLKTRGVRFVFQPAEEVGTGALDVLKEGVIEPLDYMFGIHLRPIEEAGDGYLSPSIEHGSAGSFEFKIVGNDAHGARPHLNHNSIEVGTDIVNMLSKIHINPMVPSSAKMTKFIAGSK